ncbi:hypothetical protein [Pseudomonas putida]|uniref:Transmembrane protein n=1 Tax=Pseudomonas putida TaxID=303 RepID=A0A8I1EB58_PSEPU|nr:hypothetical protein [Pseudomonas putida]MBI6882530.1 hypothetical protein [Pseudomonas putida]
MSVYLDLIPAFVAALGAMLAWIVFFRHRLAYSTVGLASLLAGIWVAADRAIFPFTRYDLPFGSQTSSLALLAIGVLLMSVRMAQRKRGFDRVFTLAFSIVILATSILFHFVMFEKIGRQWVHDALEVSETPLAASNEKMGDVCRSVLLECHTKPLASSGDHLDTGTLFMLRSRDRVVLEGAVSLYPLTRSFHQGKADYMAAYHVRDGRLIELKDNIHPRVIGQVMYLGMDVLSLAVGLVWISGALYLISFHRKKLNGRRRVPTL